MKDRPIYVISDLHMGNGGKRDNFAPLREKHFNRFLDHVEHSNGRLFLLGDIFELWQNNIFSILEKRRKTLDRLADIDAIYITGNHDEDILAFDEPCKLHRFFENIRKPFVESIGGKRFKFMHGHEQDPLISSKIAWGIKLAGQLFNRFEVCGDSCIFSNDAISDALLEYGEKTIAIWNSIKKMLSLTADDISHALHFDKHPGLHALNTTMLKRYYQEKIQNLYDIAIAGHSHKPDGFDGWYYNSGSWTGKANNFLRISSSLRIEILNWDGTNVFPVSNSQSKN